MTAEITGYNDPNAIALLSVNFPTYVVGHDYSDNRVRLINTDELGINYPNEYPAAFWIPEKFESVSDVCEASIAGAVVGIIFGILACGLFCFIIRKSLTKAAESV